MTILIVDDDRLQRELLSRFLRERGYEVQEAATAEEALERLQACLPALILLDVRLPGRSGLELLPELKQVAPGVPVLLITAYAEVRQAVAAIKAGATDYLTKPLDLEELLTAIADNLPAQGQSLVSQTVLPPLPAGFVCTSPAMRRLLETVAAVATADVPVLITGESGTGKEWIARTIHLWSPRASGPFVAVNCAAVPETLLESELFGHTRGAFTGAGQNRVGFFRSAHGGTLFLDEVGEFPLSVQPKILRAIEMGQVVPVGADQPLSVDVRVVAATNRDLMAMVEARSFRADLFYRLNVIELHVPPLRERIEEILPLARHFAAQMAKQNVRFSPEAEECLLAYPWPGNVRELRNAVHRACLLSRGDVILPEHLPPAVQAVLGRREGPVARGRLSQLEQAAILTALAECQGNRTRAAEKLGISRRALIYKLRAMEAQGIPLPGADRPSHGSPSYE